MALLYPLQMLLDWEFDTSRTGICKCSIRFEVCCVRKMVDSMAKKRRPTREAKREKIKQKNGKRHLYCNMIFTVWNSHLDKRLLFCKLFIFVSFDITHTLELFSVVMGKNWGFEEKSLDFYEYEIKSSLFLPFFTNQITHTHTH